MVQNKQKTRTYKAGDWAGNIVSCVFFRGPFYLPPQLEARIVRPFVCLFISMICGHFNVPAKLAGCFYVFFALGELQDKRWSQACLPFSPPVHAVVFYMAHTLHMASGMMYTWYDIYLVVWYFGVISYSPARREARNVCSWFLFT